MLWSLWKLGISSTTYFPQTNQSYRFFREVSDIVVNQLKEVVELRFREFHFW